MGLSTETTTPVIAALLMKTFTIVLFLLSSLISLAADGYPVPVQYRIPVGRSHCAEPVKIANDHTLNPGSWDLPPAECGPFSGGDVWAVADAPPSGKLVVTGDYSDFSITRMAFYVWRNGVLINVACARPDRLHQVPETLIRDLIPGEPLFVRIWDAGNDERGTASICAFDPEPRRTGRESDPAAAASERIISLPNLTTAGWRAYPNPASDYLMVEPGPGIRTGKIYLTNLLGRVMLESVLDGTQESVRIDTKEVPEGMYNLIWQTERGTESKRIRIRH